MSVQLARIRRDPVAAAEQVAALVARVRDPGVRLAAEEALIARRQHLVGGGAPHRVAVARVRPGGSALAAVGELVAVLPRDHLLLRDLRRQGFDDVTSVGPVRRLRHREAPMTAVLDAVSALHHEGVAASPNYVHVAAPPPPRPTREQPGVRSPADRRGAGVRIAVVGSGIDPRAVTGSAGWLDGVAVDPEGVVNRDLLDVVPYPDGVPDPGAGHGTFVAGVIRQLAPAAEVVAVKALDADGVGTDFSVADALIRLAHAGRPADVVVLPAVCREDDVAVPAAVRAALTLMLDLRPLTLVVAAAGDEGDRLRAHPAAHPGVLAVTAAGPGGPAPYASHGEWIDFSVPADGVVGTFGGGFAAWSGSSVAVPQIAGLLGDLLSQGLTPYQAVEDLRRTGTPVRDAGIHLTPDAGLIPGG